MMVYNYNYENNTNINEEKIKQNWYFPNYTNRYIYSDNQESNLSARKPNGAKFYYGNLEFTKIDFISLTKDII